MESLLSVLLNCVKEYIIKVELWSFWKNKIKDFFLWRNGKKQETIWIIVIKENITSSISLNLINYRNQKF